MADRHAVGVLEAHSGGRETVEVGRLIGSSAIGTQHFASDVVGENQQDVRGLSRLDRHSLPLASPAQSQGSNQQNREEVASTHSRRIVFQHPRSVNRGFEGRSRFARLGLMIHVTSALVQPGVNSHQVLEMGNVSGHPLAIHAGVRICQLVLMRTEGEAVYTGRFSHQDAV